MNSRLISKELEPILRKVDSELRISGEDAMVLYESADINGIGAIANIVRERKNGNVATYIHNRYVNYSNVCILACQFCAFGAKKREAHAFELAIPEIVDSAREALKQGITEIHMVGGLHPSLKGDWYLQLLRELSGLDRKLIIKAFTAIEVRHLSERVFRKSIRETLELLRENGLGAITGRSEILIPRFATRSAMARRVRRVGRVHRTCSNGGSTHHAVWPYRACPAPRRSPAPLGELQMRPAASLDSFPSRSSPTAPGPFFRGNSHATAFEEVRQPGDKPYLPR
jgi:aminodeoxyfutalosine synthase